MPTREEVTAALVAAGGELQRAEEARTAALRAVEAAVQAADGIVSVSVMAELACVSRPTVYKYLGNKGA